MLTPASAPTYLDRALGYLAPQWALRRQRARAALHFEAARADPERLRYIDGRPWTRVDGPPTAPERRHWEPLADAAAPPPAVPAALPRWRPSTWLARPLEGGARGPRPGAPRRP